MTDRLDDFQLDHFASQQPQTAVGIPLRWRPQAGGDDPGLLFAVEQFLRRGLAALPALECLVETMLDKALSNRLGRPRATREGIRNSCIRPTRPIRICLEQNVSARTFWLRPETFWITSRNVLRFDSVSRTMYFFCMGTLPGSPDRDKFSRFRQPELLEVTHQ